jgi:hypothetical protein
VCWDGTTSDHKGQADSWKQKETKQNNFRYPLFWLNRRIVATPKKQAISFLICCFRVCIFTVYPGLHFEPLMEYSTEPPCLLFVVCCCLSFVGLNLPVFELTELLTPMILDLGIRI